MLETRGYVFVTPLWGDAYTSLFLNVALPTQLAPGNLPAMRHLSVSLYQIYTTAADEARIRASALFPLLSSLVEVRFVRIDPAASLKHGVMSDCYRQAIELARQADAGIVFLTPDMIMSDGALACMERHGDEGKSAVMIVGLRLNEETTTPFLQSQADSSGAIAVSPRQLMSYALGHLHQITLDHIWNVEGERKIIPNNLFWLVGDEGLLGRCFHLMPILVRPEMRDVWFSSTVDDDFLAAACPDPSRHHIVTDSDELLICEVTESARSLGGYPRRGIETLRNFAELLADDVHREHVRIPIRMHKGIRNEALWRDAESGSATVIEGALAGLNRSWRKLLWREPVTLARRLFRLQNSYRVKLRTGQPLPVAPVSARLIIILGWGVMKLVPLYGRFLRWSRR